MLIADRDASGTACRYVLRPTRSLSTKGMIWFVAGVGTAAFLIALRFVFLGAWVVLPLALADELRKRLRRVTDHGSDRAD